MEGPYDDDSDEMAVDMDMRALDTGYNFRASFEDIRAPRFDQGVSTPLNYTAGGTGYFYSTPTYPGPLSSSGPNLYNPGQSPQSGVFAPQSNFEPSHLLGPHYSTVYAFGVAQPEPLPWPGPATPSTPGQYSSDDTHILYLEAAFAARVFEGVLPGTARNTRRRAIFQWPSEPSTEDRLLVALRCIKNAGFDDIGDFLAALFATKESRKGLRRHGTVSQSVSAFLQCWSPDKRTHPLAIIKLMFRHPKSQVFTGGIPDTPQFNLPRYALPPSQRLCPKDHPLVTNTTRNALLDWSLALILKNLDREANRLLLPEYGLTWPPSIKHQLSWSDVLGWSMTRAQETIATQAPITFALLTTLSVSQRSRNSLEAAVSGSSQPLPESGVQGHGASATGTSLLSDSDDEDGVGLFDHDSDVDVNGEEPSVPDETCGVPLKMQRDPWLGATVALLSLLYFRYKFAVVFPTFIGLFLFTCNANRDIFSVLGRIGISIAYSSVLSALHLLAADSDLCLRAMGALIQTCEPNLLLLFDNVNKMQRAWEKTIGHGDEMKSGTAATVIELEDVPEGAMRAEPLLERLKKQERKQLTTSVMLGDIDWNHITGVGTSTVLRAWLKHVGPLAKFRSDINSRFSEMHAKHPLRLRKSKIHTMRTTDIDEATTTGIVSVLYNLVVGQLGIMTRWMDTYLIMVCGDQLSIDRLRKAKWYMAKTGTAYDRHDWALPIIQLWHMKWTLQKCIFRLHWWDNVGKSIFGLHHDCDLLGRGKFNPVKCDFYPAHHILEDRFDAFMLDALRILCEERTGITKPPTRKLLEGLDEYFGDSGPLSKCSFDELLDMAESVYRRYMCNAAYKAAIGHDSHPHNLYGPSKTTDSAGGLATGFIDTKHTSSAAPKRRSTKKAVASEIRNFAGGDQSLATTINFIRLTFWYLEMCSATAEGDIGRVFEIIKLLRFSFWGAGSTNYGNELLELACNFLYEFSPALKTAVLNNYLVNPSGLRGHWLELDLLQEHFNFWIKRLFNSKSHDFDGKHLSEAVSLNIGGFSMLRDRFPGLFGAKKNSHHHSPADKRDDLDRLGAHFKDDHILSFVPNRSQVYTVQDEFAAGISILAGGQLTTFLQRTTQDGPGIDDDSELTSADPDSGLSDNGRTPTNPITSEVEGITGINPFIGDDFSTY